MFLWPALTLFQFLLFPGRLQIGHQAAPIAASLILQGSQHMHLHVQCILFFKAAATPSQSVQGSKREQKFCFTVVILLNGPRTQASRNCPMIDTATFCGLQILELETGDGTWDWRAGCVFSSGCLKVWAQPCSFGLDGGRGYPQLCLPRIKGRHAE
jgi:hypothetical protein